MKGTVPEIFSKGENERHKDSGLKEGQFNVNTE